MLPINLLPNYIFDKNKKLKAWVACIAAIAAVAVFFVIWSGNVQKTVDDAHTELNDATAKQKTYNDRVSDINKVKAQIADTENKQNFIASAQKYNAAWPEAFSLIRDLTDKDVLLKNMAFTGTDHKTIRVSAFAVREETIANWWMKLRNRTDIFENVNMQYPGHPYHPGAATAAAGMGMPGSGGMGMPGSGGGAQRPSLMAMGGSGGGMPSSGGMGMGMPGSGGAAGGDAVGPTTIEDRPGINFIATMVLKVPLDNGAAAPVWTGAAAAPAPAAAAAAPKRASAGTAGGRKDNGE